MDRIGKYAVGAFPGWQRSVKERAAKAYTVTRRGQKQTFWAPAEKTVLFRKSVGKSVAEIDFSLTTYREPVSSNEVIAGIETAETVMKMVTPTYSNKTLWSKKTSFYGKDAYLRSLRYRYAVNNLPVEEVALTFWSGKDVYTVSRRLRGVSIEPGLRTETQRVWDRLLKAVHSR